MICITSVDTIRTPVVDVIGQLIRDVIGRLSVELKEQFIRSNAATARPPISVRPAEI